ncbi:hypothetical protein OF83DRAFT_1227854 [Amylostereum chailletii]|nr:hypothetical protein OF83DRAFT_1227854 [Amylostereum chailletii]
MSIVQQAWPYKAVQQALRIPSPLAVPLNAPEHCPIRDISLCSVWQMILTGSTGRKVLAIQWSVRANQDICASNTLKGPDPSKYSSSLARAQLGWAFAADGDVQPCTLSAANNIICLPLVFRLIVATIRTRNQTHSNYDVPICLFPNPFGEEHILKRALCLCITHTIELPNWIQLEHTMLRYLRINAGWQIKKWNIMNNQQIQEIHVHHSPAKVICDKKAVNTRKDAKGAPDNAP